MDARPNLRSSGLLSGALLVLAALAAPAAAQDVDTRWLPWLGCWEAVGEAADGAEGSLLCVRPSGAGVEVVGVVDGEVTGTETLTADGARHDLSLEGCSGWTEARFSDDARRVYNRTEQRCEGETTRVSTGLIAMTSPYEWIEVESIDVGERNVAWVKRYRAADAETTAAAGFGDVLQGRGMAVESARMAASAPIGVADVIEASAEVHPEAVEAWIADTNDPLLVDSEGLLAMADAGVPERVIDVVVAVSYPERFAVDREAEPRDRREYGDYYGHRPRGWFGSSWYDRYYYGGYGYGYYGSPWGYGGGWSYGYRPSIVIVQPRNTESGGRVIAGRGYRRGGGSSSGAPSTIGRSGGSSSGGSVAPSGASSGSGSSSGGRKAKPRGGPPPSI